MFCGAFQDNAELREYERMRAFYAGKDKESPYATLSAFRRARRAQSKNYLERRKEWTQTAKENRKKPLTNAQNSGILQETIPLPDDSCHVPLAQNG